AYATPMAVRASSPTTSAAVGRPTPSTPSAFFDRFVGTESREPPTPGSRRTSSPQTVFRYTGPSRQKLSESVVVASTETAVSSVVARGKRANANGRPSARNGHSGKRVPRPRGGAP